MCLLGACSNAGTYDFEFARGYSEFYLRDYYLTSNADDNSDINAGDFVQTIWTVGYDSGGTTGDVSFGSPSDAGPATSYAAAGAVFMGFKGDAEPYPGPPPAIHAVGSSSAVFRIAFSERGDESEGWIAWSAGEIGLR